MRRRFVLVILLSVLLLVPSFGAHAEGLRDEGQVVHIVRSGQTLFSIARLYGVPMQAIVEANQIRNPRLIFEGQRLIIPVPTEDEADKPVIHVVAWGETLIRIAARYGVTIQAILARNGLTNPNLIYVGQRLVIPIDRDVPPAPRPAPPVVQEAIVILSPAFRANVSSPVTITGWGSGFEQTLAVDILDESGNAIGQGFVMVDAEMGEYGPFSGTVAFDPPAAAQLGRIQVYSISPRDGAIEHLSSVVVTLQP